MNLLLTTKLNLNKYQSSKPVYLRDTKTRGFAIKVNPSGSHRYVVEFFRQGKSKRITLGSTVEMTLSDAKHKAITILADNASNVSVNTVQNIMVSDLLQEYLRSKKLSQRSIQNYSQVFKYFSYEKSNIQQIETAEVMKWYIKGAHVPATTDQVYRELKAIFNYAVQMQYINTNPFNLPSGVRYKPNVKDNYLEPKEQLPKFWKALNAQPDGKISMTRDILKMYLMTGIRRNELYKAELKEGMIKIPNTKNGTDHHIPVVDEMPLHLFNKDRDKWTKDCRKTIARVCKQADLPVVTIHDLRRTVASLCAYLGIGLTDIKHLLNHSVKGDVTLSHYIQHRTDYLVPVMKKIEAYYSEI